MNVYANTLEEIASSGNTRMTITKMKYEFAQNPIRAIHRTNALIWGGASSLACASLLIALSCISASRYGEAIRTTLETAIWHPEPDISNHAVMALAKWNDERAIRPLENLLAFRPNDPLILNAIEELCKPL